MMEIVYRVNKFFYLVNECTDMTCQNGGTCTMKFGHFNCKCKPEYTGIYCHIPNDPQMVSSYLSTLLYNI